MNANGGETILELQGVTKTYPGVTALDRVDFRLQEGEVHVLVGENGAGKSTLVGVVSGAIAPDRVDAMKFRGREVSFDSPRDALDAGIATVRQHFSLVPTLSVAENIALNREPVRTGRRIDMEKVREEAVSLLSELGVSLDPRKLVGELGPEDQQIVEICKAIAARPSILVLDEPTSGLNREEIERLFALIEGLRSRGVTIMYISHRLEEVFRIGETVTILRDGSLVHTGPLAELDHGSLVTHIVGREMGKAFPKEHVPQGREVLRVESLSNEDTEVPLYDVSFSLRAGEILGVYGIMGSGKEALARTVAGAVAASSGAILIDGQAVQIRNPRDAIAHGIGYVTDDRARDGLLLQMTVKQNQTIVALSDFARLGYIRKEAERQTADDYIRKMSIRTPSREALIRNLSGGNQQKVVIAKWLIANSRILVVSEPTKGIDIGAKVDVFRLLSEQAKAGVGVLFISSELDELVGMCDRVGIMRNGRFVEMLPREELSTNELLRIATRSDSAAPTEA
jgi:ABC-type sugar transport system ATPase subunit